MWTDAKLAAILTAMAVAVAVAPLVVPGLPLGADGAAPLYTVVQLDDLLRHGVPFSRWLPWGNGGLGNPRFLYYPWLPYYLAEPAVLLGASFPVALKLSQAIALLLAGAGAFGWSRHRFGPAAGAVGAAAYVLSPYVLYAVYARGSFAELWALGLAPWVLLAAERWREAPSPRRLAASAGLAAAAILLHPITGAILLLPWLVLQTRIERPPRARWAAPLVVLALALGASAVLWLPAGAERALIGDAHTLGPGLDYRLNFLPLNWFVALPWRGLEPGLSPLALALAAIGVWVAAKRNDEERPPFLAVAGCAAVLVLLAQPLARPLWESVHTAVRDIQFPQRLLGPAALLLAHLAAGGMAALLAWAPYRVRGVRGVPAAGALAAILLAILLCESPPIVRLGRLRRAPPLDAAFVVAKEREAGFRGRGIHGDFMPAGVSSLARAWNAAPIPAERFDSASLPPGGRLIDTSYEPLRYELLTSATTPFEAAFRTFAFAGWKASADGVALSTGRTPEGLLTVSVPAGERRIVVRFGSTPARRLGATVTLVSLLVLAALSLRRAPRDLY